MPSCVCQPSHCYCTSEIRLSCPSVWWAKQTLPAVDDFLRCTRGELSFEWTVATFAISSWKQDVVLTQVFQQPPLGSGWFATLTTWAYQLPVLTLEEEREEKKIHTQTNKQKTCTGSESRRFGFVMVLKFWWFHNSVTLGIWGHLFLSISVNFFFFNFKKKCVLSPLRN